MFANRQKKGCTRRWCTPFFESYVAIFQYSRFFGICQLFQFCIWVCVLVLVFGGIWGNHLADGSARLGHIPSLPRKPQLPLKPCIALQPSDFKGNCGSIPIFSLIFIVVFCAVSFATQMWATRPHLGSIFEKLLHRKTFQFVPAQSVTRPQFRLWHFLLTLLIVNTAANKFPYQRSFWNPVQRKRHLLFQNRF